MGDVLPAGFIDSGRFFGGKRAVEESHVDKVEFLAKGPRLGDVVDLEDAVGRDPGGRWRI